MNTEKPEETIIILLSLFMMITALLTMSLIISRKVASQSFLLKKKFRKISWSKVFKMWLKIQVVCFLFIRKDTSSIIITFGLPILIIYLLITTLLSFKLEDKIEDINEFKEYEKSFIRNKKIDNIL